MRDNDDDDWMDLFASERPAAAAVALRSEKEEVECPAHFNDFNCSETNLRREDAYEEVRRLKCMLSTYTGCA